MEITFTLDEDISAHISCMSEDLRKRQFAMDAVINVGEGAK